MIFKIEKYLFYLFLFYIPLGTRKILWYSSWRFNEWQSISLYATDLLLLMLFIFWAIHRLNYGQSSWPDRLVFLTGQVNLNFLNNFKAKLKNPDFYLVLLLVIAGISIKNSDSLVISRYQWFKLLEFVLLYLYIKNYAFYRFGLVQSAWAIVIGGAFQAIIAIGQFLKQSSLGFRYLGESLLSTDIQGTAYFLNPAGEHIIRAYGTTPHPNILAGYLLLVLWATYYVLRVQKDLSRFAYRLLLIAYSLVLFGFFLTFSRVVILAWAGAFIVGVLLYYRSYPKLVKDIFITTFLVSALFVILYWPEILARLTIPSDDESLVLRKYYASESLRSGFNLFGVGIGNFINWFIVRNPYIGHWLYQPVHNVYLLIYSEMGLLGISAFLLFFFSLIKKSFSRLTAYSLLLVACLFFVGFFDHFLWTIQQGRFIFWLSLALLTFYKKDDTM